MNGIATSTVAMTAYNWLAVGAGGRTLAEVADGVSAWAAESRVVVSEKQIRVALGELVKRGFVREIAGLFDVVDARRRVVASRDRVGDGWSGWRVHSTARLEDVTK